MNEEILGPDEKIIQEELQENPFGDAIVEYLAKLRILVAGTMEEVMVAPPGTILNPAKVEEYEQLKNDPAFRPSYVDFLSTAFELQMILHTQLGQNIGKTRIITPGGN